MDDNNIKTNDNVPNELLSQTREVQHEQEPIQVEVKENPLLKKIQMPGQKFRLPSKGLFYKNGELAKHVKNGEVEVFPMKTIDEINLKTPDMIFQGTAISRVFERCIPDIKKPLELLSKDVDYLMGALRRVSYGNELPIKTSCKCSNHKVMREYNVPLDQMLSKTQELDENNIESEYVLELYNEALDVTQVVQMRPPTFNDWVDIYQFQATEINKLDNMENTDFDDTSESAVNEYISLTVASVVESVDGIDDEELIKEWAKNLPALLKLQLSDKIDSLTEWGAKFSYTVNCFDCGIPLDVTAMLNPVGFFSLPSRPTKTK